MSLNIRIALDAMGGDNAVVKLAMKHPSLQPLEAVPFYLIWH